MADTDIWISIKNSDDHMTKSDDYCHMTFCKKRMEAAPT